jgi:antitoxin ParD1/3/4
MLVKTKKAMSRNTSVEIGNEVTEFIDHQVTAGLYGSASEAIRTSIRLLEDQETKMYVLRLALREDEVIGPSVLFGVGSS